MWRNSWGSGRVRTWIKWTHGASWTRTRRAGTDRAQRTLNLLFNQLFGMVDLLWRATNNEHFEVGVAVGWRLP